MKWCVFTKIRTVLQRYNIYVNTMRLLLLSITKLEVKMSYTHKPEGDAP